MYCASYLFFQGDVLPESIVRKGNRCTVCLCMQTLAGVRAEVDNNGFVGSAGFYVNDPHLNSGNRALAVPPLSSAIRELLMIGTKELNVSFQNC